MGPSRRRKHQATTTPNKRAKLLAEGAHTSLGLEEEEEDDWGEEEVDSGGGGGGGEATEDMMDLDNLDSDDDEWE